MRIVRGVVGGSSEVEDENCAEGEGNDAHMMMRG